MSIIQRIRDKYSRIAVIAIAVALLGFILIDYISGKSRGLFSSGGGNTIGTVNGRKISFDEFNKKVSQQDAYMQQQGYGSGDAVRSQAINSVWEQEISKILVTSETDKLGISVGKRGLNDILFGANPPEDLRRQFTDPQTGQYNSALAIQQINEMKKRGTAEQKAGFNEFLNQLELIRESEKYVSLLSNSINYPRWFLEKQNADNSQLANISIVRKTYTEIPDSLVKVSDQEIEDFINKHKEQYKQQETRSIEYVSFSAAPSPTDSAAAMNKILSLKQEIDSTKDIKQILLREGVSDYDTSYKNAKQIQSTAKDSLLKATAGRVYGPYIEGGNYMLAKVEGVKRIPAEVKVRHILVSTAQRDPQTGQMTQTRDSVSAKNIIDSARGAIQAGISFDSVCVKLSDDGGSKFKGGVYDSVKWGSMVPAFNDFIFTNPTGAKGVVKTEFGYHYIEILSQKGSDTAYKIAFLPKRIEASPETDNNASNQASLFAGDSRDQKSFDENYEKNLKPKGIIKKTAADIGPMDVSIQEGTSRPFVKAIYDAKKGEVLQPERVGQDYVVAVVTEINKEGTQSVAKARYSIEPLIRNKKKAEQIKQKLGKISTLEAASAALGKPIEPIDSVRMMSGASKLGYEPKISGAAFNPANKGKVVPEALAGSQGVYVLRVENITTTAVANANIADQRKNMYEQVKQFMGNSRSPGYPLNILQKAATITDKRGQHY